MKENTSAQLLENCYGSKMIVKGERILFTAPAKALVATLFGNPLLYEGASLMMQLAEREHRFLGMVEK